MSGFTALVSPEAESSCRSSPDLTSPSVWSCCSIHPHQPIPSPLFDSEFMLLLLLLCRSDFEEPIPDDRYHGIYFAMLLAGVGFLLPYNSFITDVDYLHQKFKGTQTCMDKACGGKSPAQLCLCVFRDVHRVRHEPDVHPGGSAGCHPQQRAGGAAQHAHQDHSR